MADGAVDSTGLNAGLKFTTFSFDISRTTGITFRYSKVVMICIIREDDNAIYLIDAYGNANKMIGTDNPNFTITIGGLESGTRPVTIKVTNAAYHYGFAIYR